MVMEKGEVIQVITRDNIRYLHPRRETTRASSVQTQSSQDPRTGRAAVLSKDEFERIKNEAILLTNDQKLQRAFDTNKEKLLAMEAAKLRKLKMEEYERIRAEKAKLSDVEQENQIKDQQIRNRAKQQLEEEEDEIKKMNEYILYAKCVAIRDEQIDEKSMISRQMKEEEQRLDTMMEKVRIEELKKLEERSRQRQIEMRKGASIIRKQIDERREAALLEQERKDQETKAILQAIKEQAEFEMEEKHKKHEEQKGLMQKIAKANKEFIEQKKTQKLKDLEEDKKVLQYLLEKEQREIELDRQQQVKRAEREKELARLRAMQEKSFDKQAQQDALRAKRALEAYERDWRRKEKETAEKLLQQEKMIREERIKQQKTREYAVAVEAQKMKQEFFDALNRQREIEEKLKADEQERHKKNRQYSLEVQAQIREKEKLRLKEREEFFKEGYRRQKERQDKDKKIEIIKERKLQELRQMGVPEKYVSEIKRKMAHDKPPLQGYIRK